MQEFFQTQMDYIFLACGLAFILLIYAGAIIACRAKKTAWFLPETLKGCAWLSAGVALVFAAGFSASEFTAEKAAYDIRDQLLNQAISIAETINSERVKSLSFTAADKGTPVFERLRGQLATYGKLIRQRSIYSMALRGGKVIFGPENLPENDPLASPPGTVYRNPPAKIFDLFSGKLSATTAGPYRDEYGTFVSAFARVPDPRTGNTVLVIGLDIPFGDWNARIAKSRMAPLLGSLIFLLLLLGGAAALKWRQGLPDAQQQRYRHIEGWLTACLGAALTIAVVMMVSGNIKRQNNITLDRIANSYFQKISLSYYTLRANIYEVGRSCEKSEKISRSMFRACTEAMVHMTTVKAYEWIPRVPAAEKEKFESEARLEMNGEYAIWEKNAQGVKIPASGQRVFYPILFAEPSAGLEKIYGFNVYSEARRRSAIETSIRTKLVSATEPVSLLQENVPPGLIMVYQPVFRSGRQENGQIRGFVLAILNPQDLFDQVLSPFISARNISVDLYDATNPDNLKFIATHPRANCHNGSSAVCSRHMKSSNAIVKPIFCFGRTYIITPHPSSPTLFRPQADAALFSGLAGLTITVLLSIFVIFLRNRQFDLEVQVRERTADLREKTEELDGFFSHALDLLCIAGTDGRFKRLNVEWETTLGYTLKELEGCRFLDLVHPDDVAGTLAAIGELASRKEVLNFINRYRCKDGSYRWIEWRSFPSGKLIYATARDITERKRAEDELRKLSQAVEQSPAIVVITDPLGNIEYVNPRFTQITGYSQAEARGNNPRMLKSGELSAETYEQLWKTITSGREWRGEFHNKKKDGTLYWESALIAPVMDANGRIAHFLAIKEDITERKRTEETLRFKNILLSTQLETSPDGILVVDEEGKIALFNHRFPEMWEIAGDVLASNSDERILQSVLGKLLDPEKFLARVKHLYEQKNEKSREEVFLKDGSVFDRYTSPLLGSDGKYYGRIWFFRDVTERKRFEEQLRESEKKYRRLVELAQEGILAVDAQADTIYINPRMAEMLGYTVEEMIGRSVFSFLDEKGVSIVKQNIELRKQGLRNQYDLEFFRKDGQRIYASVEASAITDDNGHHLGSLAMVADITQRKLAEQALAEKNLQLQEMYEQTKKLAIEAQAASLAKGRFVANISHEIRTPLNGIIGISDLLMGTKMTTEQKEYAQTINASAESLLNIINATLDFSKIEAGKIELEHINFNLRYIMEDIIGVLAVNASQKDIEITSFIEPAVPLNLNGDPGRLRQVLFNLIGNAIKFTSKGEIVITVAPVEENEKTASLRFSVRDTGIGIPADKIGLLFNAFTQADESFTRKFGGTGLGLAISKGLVQQMEGKIGVESSPDKGSNFWFVIPFLKQNPPVTESFEPEAYFGGQRILIVDDNETNRTILVMQLQAWGAVTEAAESGAQAIKKLLLAGEQNQKPFSAVVLDQRMPEMDGLTLAKNIKADPELQDLPLILMTSMILPTELYEEQKKNFVGVILKPIRQSHLYYSLLTALSGENAEKIAEIKAEASAGSVSPVALRILIAEDNVTNQKVVCGILNKMGHSTTAVANGKEAVDVLKVVPFDLVLMDIQMPEMDGFEAAAMIRNPASEVRDHNVPILALTAHALEDDRRKCLETGMNGYIAKPVTTKSLLSALEDIVARRGIKNITRELERQNHAALPVFDEKSFSERLLNDRDLMRETIRIFLDDAPKRISELDKKVKERNQEEAIRLAHTLKGSSANVSGRKLSDAALQIETACRSADWRQAESIIPKLQRQFESLSKAMEALQQRLKT